METTTDTKNSFINTFREFEAGLNGSAQGSLHEKRKEAISLFEKTGFPPTRDEEYRYTNIAKALQKSLGSNTGQLESDMDAQAIEGFLFKGLEANQLVFINGRFKPGLSQIISDPKNILIQELSEAYKEQPEKVGAAISKHAKPESDAFVALNTAFAHNGVYIEVPDNTVAEHPVVLNFISDGTKGTTTSMPRNLFLVGRSASVSIVEAFSSIGENTTFTNIVTEIDVQQNAQVQFVKLQTEEDKAIQVNNTHIYQQADSRVTTTTISLGGNLIRNNLNYAVDAKNCESNMYGLYYLHGNQHVDNHTVVDHRQPHCESNELYKGIMDDSSTGVFNGKIYVRQAAQKTNAFQSNKNLLLSDNATINTKPQLEIWADDVKCSHGATTGQIDQEQIFYLRSRGLSRESAQALLLFAFAGEIIEHISLEPLRAYFTDILEMKLKAKYQG